MSVRMPGAFPGSADVATNIKPQTFALLDQQLMERFEHKQKLGYMTKHQHNFVAQSESLVYIILAYQFVKFCHSACLLPPIIQIIMQKLVNTKFINNGSLGIGLLTAGASESNGMSPAERAQTIEKSKKTACFALFCTTAIVLAYHTLFVCSWLTGLATENKLSQLEYGTWWFISFIGEAPPVDASGSFLQRVVALGLPQILASDLLILFIQLVLFQCIFHQSLAMQTEHRLDGNEVEMIRGVNDGTGTKSGPELDRPIPCVLKIRLYELFSNEAFM